MNELDQMITKVRNRLQFVMVLALFYPVMLDAFYRSMEQEFAGSFTLLKWGAVIATITLNYIFFEIIAAQLSQRSLKFIDFLMLLEIGAFVPVFIVFGMIQTGAVSTLWFFSYVLGYVFSLVIPMLVFVFLSSRVNWLLFKDILTDVRDTIAVLRGRHSDSPK